MFTTNLSVLSASNIPDRMLGNFTTNLRVLSASNIPDRMLGNFTTNLRVLSASNIPDRMLANFTQLRTAFHTVVQQAFHYFPSIVTNFTGYISSSSRMTGLPPTVPQVHAAQRENCTPVQSPARRGDVVLVDLTAAALLDLKRGERSRQAGPLRLERTPSRVFCAVVVCANTPISGKMNKRGRITDASLHNILELRHSGINFSQAMSGRAFEINVGHAASDIYLVDQMTRKVRRILELVLLVHWLLSRSEDISLLTTLHTMKAHHYNVFIHWRKGFQDVSNEVGPRVRAQRHVALEEYLWYELYTTRNQWPTSLTPSLRDVLFVQVSAPLYWNGFISGLTRIQNLDKIDFKRVYTEVTFTIRSEFIRHALDDFAPIADLQGNKKLILAHHNIERGRGSQAVRPLASSQGELGSISGRVDAVGRRRGFLDNLGTEIPATTRNIRAAATVLREVLVNEIHCIWHAFRTTGQCCIRLEGDQTIVCNIIGGANFLKLHMDSEFYLYPRFRGDRNRHNATNGIERTNDRLDKRRQAAELITYRHADEVGCREILVCQIRWLTFVSPDSLRTQHMQLAERLACSDLTKAIRVQSLAGSLRIFASGNHAERCRCSAAGFLGDFPFLPPLHAGAAPSSPVSPSSALKTSMHEESEDLSNGTIGSREEDEVIPGSHHGIDDLCLPRTTVDQLTMSTILTASILPAAAVGRQGIVNYIGSRTFVGLHVSPFLLTSVSPLSSECTAWPHTHTHKRTHPGMLHPWHLDQRPYTRPRALSLSLVLPTPPAYITPDHTSSSTRHRLAGDLLCADPPSTRVTAYLLPDSVAVSMCRPRAHLTIVIVFDDNVTSLKEETTMSGPAFLCTIDSDQVLHLHHLPLVIVLTGILLKGSNACTLNQHRAVDTHMPRAHPVVDVTSLEAETAMTSPDFPCMLDTDQVLHLHHHLLLEVLAVKMADILSWSTIVLDRHRSSIPRWPPVMASQFGTNFSTSDRFRRFVQTSATLCKLPELWQLALAANWPPREKGKKREILASPFLRMTPGAAEPFFLYYYGKREILRENREIQESVPDTPIPTLAPGTMFKATRLAEYSADAVAIASLGTCLNEIRTARVFKAVVQLVLLSCRRAGFVVHWCVKRPPPVTDIWFN
ncbi:hypothetical protein PR048_018911 [Dryococelus australis]|uniref:Uncharacterized protein n=1 Tax=Dryococelus australis TaxID=614101 RepID=A0ABQ9H245_9NEOP|nr:hypothetical protein PR048_018911 [Dryococelus australis]